MKITDLKDYHVVSSATGQARGSSGSKPTQEGFLSRVTSDIKKRGENFDAQISDTTQNPITAGIRAAGEGAGAILDIGTEAVKSVPVLGDAVEAIGSAAGKGVGALTNTIADTKLFREAAQYPEQTKVLEDYLSAGKSLGDIANAILASGSTAKSGQAAVDTTGAAIKQGGRITKKLVTSGTEFATTKLGSPEKSAAGAAGEVLQGKPKDIARGIEAIKAIDTKGVETYDQLSKRLDDGIGNLSKTVDDYLAQDTTRRPLQELTTDLKTKSGLGVSTNFVDTSLKHLDELYEKTGDLAKRADIQEVIQTAKKDGLTNLEINDIARTYNTEFGKKAFSKLGEPLTSVNAQMYENVRKGLKGVARRGLGGGPAAEADKVISSLYNTQTLVQKNVEAVAKLQQRIAERGLLEKVGHGISKYADILTGGSIRGLVGGLLPRGAGYKVLNALDLEERLKKNLEIINKASVSGSEKEIMAALKRLTE